MKLDRAIIQSNARRLERQYNCSHPEIQCTLRCKECGKINTINVKANELSERVMSSLFCCVKVIKERNLHSVVQ